MRTLLSSLALATLVVIPETAIACGALSEAGKYNRQKQLDNMREVRGVFRVIERIEHKYIDYLDEEQVSETVFGRIETARGTGWNTVHTYHPNLIVCRSFFPPAFDAEGTFFINRRKARADDFEQVAGRSGKFYEMRHYEGDYLPRPALNDGGRQPE